MESNCNCSTVGGRCDTCWPLLGPETIKVCASRPCDDPKRCATLGACVKTPVETDSATPEWNKVEGFKGKIDGGAVKEVMFTPKLSLELISPQFLTAIAQVLGHGAKKYSSSNWLRGMKYTVVFGSILRHLFLWAAGVELDADSKFPHLSCAACGLMFLIHYNEVGGDYKQFDDRVFNQ